MTEKFVSSAKSRTAAFTRTTFSAPAALPAMMFDDPRSTYFTSAGNRICVVLE